MLSNLLAQPAEEEKKEQFVYTIMRNKSQILAKKSSNNTHSCHGPRNVNELDNTSEKSEEPRAHEGRRWRV